ncbi:CehA/McbA family metallohydrolase [Paucibacter sp. KBW04]|uniref:CehA/McbA family metallohydrolase n=1 Tax=Paucibacter sp. KBW04 TaxID=2153361 RepID=UPI0018CC0730|nr:CehA/McbA family metallohydrolase [Paucibacter sp. KBW04]
MARHPFLKTSLALALLPALLSLAGGKAQAGAVDHQEFDATLQVPFRATDASQARRFTLRFEYPHLAQAQAVSWRLELLSPKGEALQRWYGVESLLQEDVVVQVDWAGRKAQPGLADGIYQLRLTAVSREASTGFPPSSAQPEFVERVLAEAQAQAQSEVEGQEPPELIEQSWDMQVGALPAVQLPAFQPLATTRSQTASIGRSAAATAANGALPYTVYYGNLHSQTNHSDGGGNLSSCGGAQAPQSAAYGPIDAFNYARDRKLDFLMASEHNHMFDGSDGTNTAQTPAYAKNLFQSGLSTAKSFNTSHPDFLALYGQEWGVINNGGHLNILNAQELFGWEYNASQQLLADTFSEKGNYAALYTLMRQRGLLGQFNHPSASGQFKALGVDLGYTADGGEAMALCEVANSGAFSTNTTETETSFSNYEGACKKALEAGFRVAFSSNQDNHCANWGASATNRTAVLIPNGTPLSPASFAAAIKARRVFATLDKNSQLILSANGHLMGESFDNAGPLKLQASFSNSAGRKAAAVQIFEGVPKRRGTVTVLSSQATTTLTPSLGAHFYYAKVTQDDGKTLWSAPLWVNQKADTTAPSVSASVSGTSGTIQLQATASDDVGVVRVEFYLDGKLVGSPTSAPYALSLDSKLLSNGAHSLKALAFDAAGNSASSGELSFNISNVQDLSSALRLSSSGLVFNRATQLYTGTLLISNGSGSALSGPLQLALTNLPAGVSLVNANGSYAGAPLLALPAGLTAGGSLSIPVSFSNPSKQAISYTAKLYRGAL